MGESKNIRIIYASNRSLCEKVLLRIKMAERRQALRNASLSVFASMLSLSGFAYAGMYLYRGLTASGFMQFASLLGTDTRLAFSYAGDYASSLVESLPVAEITVFMMVGLACSYFIWNVITNVSILRHGNRTLKALAA